MKNRIVVGLTTRVIVFGSKGKKEVIARIDTGATKSSVDEKLAAELGLGPELKRAFVKSAYGSRQRSVVVAEIGIGGQIMQAEFTLAERTHMKYRVLIGQNILKRGFLIDPMRRSE